MPKSSEAMPAKKRGPKTKRDVFYIVSYSLTGSLVIKTGAKNRGA